MNSVFSQTVETGLLFGEYEYLNHPFPEPQYLGAKYAHLNWISNFIPAGVHRVLDAFSGSQSVAFLFKQLGYETITNDFLNFNHQIGLALIENKSEILNKRDIDLLFSTNQNDGYDLMQNVFSGIFFELSETQFLDNFRANIECLSSKYKKALALTIINRSMTRKVTMGHFCHTQALRYASDPNRIKRNRCLIRPLKEIFFDLLPLYNQAVFHNFQKNISYQKNILDLLPTLSDIDLVYFDPPYCGSHADYQSFYHLLETYTEYWKDKNFINGTHRYDPQRISGFDKKKDALISFNKLFELSETIPYWLISYNDRSYPDIQTFVEIISKYRNVRIEEKTYSSSRGGKGSVAGSHEILFICSPK